MAPGLEDVKYIDQLSKDIVFGFVKDMHSLILSENVYYNIPSLVISWCLLYFHQNEYFTTADDTHPEVGVEINESGNIATTKEGWTQQIFGVLEISGREDLKYIWEIKIINGKRENWYNYIHIGLTYQSLKDNENNQDGDKSITFYGYDADGLTCAGSVTYYQYGEKYGCNDIISMELNVKDRTLQFYKNNESQGIAYDNLKFDKDMVYKMTVAMSSKGNSVQLIQFKRTRAWGFFKVKLTTTASTILYFP